MSYIRPFCLDVGIASDPKQFISYFAIIWSNRPDPPRSSGLAPLFQPWSPSHAWSLSCLPLGHDMSYGQNLVHGEGTSLSRVGPYRFCSGGTLYKPAWGYRFGYRFRVGPYRFCSDGNPTTLSILLWSYLILSDTHIRINPVMVSAFPVMQTQTQTPQTQYTKWEVGGLDF